MQGGDNVIEICKNDSINDEGNEEETPKKDMEEKSEQKETQNTDEVKGKDTNETEMNSDENINKEDNKSEESLDIGDGRMNLEAQKEIRKNKSIIEAESAEETPNKDTEERSEEKEK